MNLLDMAVARKTKTFFNKFVAQAKRSKTDIKIKVSEREIVHSLDFDNLRISAVSNFNSVVTFKEMNVNMEEWYNEIGKIKKGQDEIQYLPVQSGQVILSLDSKVLKAKIEEKQEPNFVWKQICDVYVSMALVNAINITNTATSNGKLPVNSKVYFSIQNGELKILNTNDIILHQNIITSIDGEDRIFAIDNSYISKLKTFIAFCNGVGNITISICENMIRFCYKLKEFYAEFLCPFEEGSEVERVFRALERLMNTKWFGRKVTLDEEDMLQAGVEYQVAWLMQNKKIQNPKLLKAELDKFTNNSNKQDALKNMNKSLIDLPYLSLSKSLQIENLFINRILYQNYISMIQELPYSIYFLNTKAEALMFGSNDEELRFKTLFMLRKPAEPVAELTDEDLDEMENAKAEISLSEEDDDTFVPT